MTTYSTKVPNIGTKMAQTLPETSFWSLRDRMKNKSNKFPIFTKLYPSRVTYNNQVSIYIHNVTSESFKFQRGNKTECCARICLVCGYCGERQHHSGKALQIRKHSCQSQNEKESATGRSRGRGFCIDKEPLLSPRHGNVQTEAGKPARQGQEGRCGRR